MAVDIKGMTPLLQVFDMATSLKFYCDVLGFQIVTTDANTIAPNHNWVWLRLNGADLMLNTAYEYDKRPLSPARDVWRTIVTLHSISALPTLMRCTPTCTPREST